MNVTVAPANSAIATAPDTSAAGEPTPALVPCTTGRLRHCWWRCAPSTASRAANEIAPSTNAHHGSISSASDAGTAYTHSRTSPHAAGVPADTARVSTSTATRPIAITTRPSTAG